MVARRVIECWRYQLLNKTQMSSELLLAQNNPVLRKQRGVWYTPNAAVDFIVRAADDIRQQLFSQYSNVLTVLGNPPYNVSSCNKDQWIETKLADYKTGLSERNIQPLSDDYIKFIRLGQDVIERNGSGILAYITNNGFLDGIIHRQMRHTLTKAFDTIYILNLHGSSRRLAAAKARPLTKDENIFDIQQGVSINFFIKHGTEKNQVFYAELLGTRQEKLTQLEQLSFDQVPWKPLALQKPYYFFVPKDFSLQKEYDTGFRVNDLFSVSVSGVKTHHDNDLVAFEPFAEFNENYCYRGFDMRYICYDLKRVERHRYNVMRHLLHGNNTALCISRQQKSSGFQHVLAVKTIADIGLLGDSTTVFPLYRAENNRRQPNLDQTVVTEIEHKLGTTIKASELFDYIYAVLHHPLYRQRYQEFLKIEFPRIPYPDDVAVFRKLVKIGTALRKLHLFENLPKRDVPFPVSGSNIVRKVRFQHNTVWINGEQYFANVPQSAWTYCIGTHQVAEKFLKDRKGRVLSLEEIERYGTMIAILNETVKLAAECSRIPLCCGS
ncbi:hypothetical protein FACS1894170_00590 [Planctomycetales bacterium]|nr:hypothetical protein FACS1894170_00590 [Planctomycetales bacterium]